MFFKKNQGISTNSNTLKVILTLELPVCLEDSSSGDSSNRKFANPKGGQDSPGSDPQHKKERMQVSFDWRCFDTPWYRVISVDTLKGMEYRHLALFSS